MSDLELLRNLAGQHHDDQRCRYHWIQRSDAVAVTLGDSYTYGAGLEPRDGVDHYGAKIGQSLGWSWINAGCQGGSNSWTINILDQMVGFLNASGYRQGVVITTLTENGRDINEARSRRFDYSIYKTLPVDQCLFDRVLDDAEDEWIQRLCRIRDQLDLRFRMIIGQNFCWHQRLFGALSAVPGMQCLPRTWVECLPGVSVPRIRTTNTAWPKTLLDMLGHDSTDVYKRWLLSVESSITALTDGLLARPDYFCSHDRGHPNARGHVVWADQILAVI